MDYSTNKVGELVLPDTNEVLVINQGIDERHIAQLILNSQAADDAGVQSYTSDPRRFGSMEAFEKWTSKGRILYTLTNKDGNLAGIQWFGPEDMPEKPYEEDFDRNRYGCTFAIRLYGEARGKGLARPFMRAVFDNLQTTPDYQRIEKNKIWLETRTTNEPALKSYRKFGFFPVYKDEKDTIMILP